MTSERLKRVTSKIEAAVERLSDIAPAAPGRAAGESDSDAIAEQHRQEIEDRDRKIAKLRADLDDISELKDQEIARLRDALTKASAKVSAQQENEPDPERLASLERRNRRLEQAARSAQSRIEALIGKLEDGDG